jgi:hypothetical protein
MTAAVYARYSSENQRPGASTTKSQRVAGWPGSVL